MAPAAAETPSPCGSTASAGPLARHFRFEVGDEQRGAPAVVEVSRPGDTDGDDDGDGTEGPQAVGEFEAALAKRRSRLAACAQTFESSPEPSRADVSHLDGVTFDGRSLQEWLGSFQDPEEDRRAEFFDRGLAARGAVPAHCPDRSARIQGLARELASLRERLESERAEREELERRHRELQAKDAALKAEQRLQQELEAARKDYPRPSWLPQLEGTINVGVVGNAGVGKSLLINRLRGLQAGASGWAPVGIRETTKLVSMYAFPCDRRVRLWDFPGAGTALFPIDTYIARLGLRYLDMVIIVTAVRFTETEILLMRELQTHQVPFFMVRTKIDIDVWNNQEDNGCDAKQTIKHIRSDIRAHCPGVEPYLVSLRDITQHDFPKLLSDIFPCLQEEKSNIHAAWDDPWSMPAVHSGTVTSIQGRWHDGSTKYCVQGLEVHVLRQNGASGTFTLTEGEAGKVWWSGRWWIDEQAARRARTTSQLRWVPANVHTTKPFVWHFSD